jgi:hypothetical protein
MNKTSTETIQTATVALAQKVMATKDMTVEQATEYVISQMIATNPALAARLLASIS